MLNEHCSCTQTKSCIKGAYLKCLIVTNLAWRNSAPLSVQRLILNLQLWSQVEDGIALTFLKMALYCSQGSGTLRKQLLMMHGIA